ncbi:MAG: 30S ribosomal protein S14 [Ignisphaera sp.]|uniref:Small ribosomal subunit protein uS14 n=1 Tax=Ignisphaera aggregans TaxID=334771 RepID=A0A7J3MZQ5_9CREN
MSKFRPKAERRHGRGTQVCKRCGNSDAVIQKYNMYLCRQCFREVALAIGFRKYN